MTDAPITADAAAKLLSRRKARHDFAAWCRVAGFEPAKHHLLLTSKLMDVIHGKLNRLIICMPPGSAKSTYSSVLFPPWFLAQRPASNILACSHSSDLATAFGRRARNLVLDHEKVLGFTLRKDSQAADEWSTTQGGFFFCAGVGGKIAGRRADLGLIDDPVGSKEDAYSKLIRDKTWDWFNTDFRTRLKPGASIVLIQCLTGDTKVTMDGGHWQYLKNIRPGDWVLSYHNGKHVPAKVLKFCSQGYDSVFEIKTGHATIKANARHPFLVERGNERVWVKAADLQKGDLLVSSRTVHYNTPPRLTEEQAWFLGYMFGDGWITTRDSQNYDKARGKHYPRRGFVTCAACSYEEADQLKIQSLFTRLFGTTPKFSKYGYFRTEVQAVGKWLIDHGFCGNAKTKRVPYWMFEQPFSIRASFLDGYNYADGHSNEAGRLGFGSCNYELICDFRQIARSLGFRVSNTSTTNGMLQAPNSPEPTYAFNHGFRYNPWQRDEEEFVGDPIRSITLLSEKEEVFDLQIEGMENFIADGVVTHNTRWHEDDLAGRILANEGGEWELINLPMLAKANDPLGRPEGEMLWKDYFTPQQLKDAMRDPMVFSALYQQDPTPQDGDYFRRAWIENNSYGEGELPPIKELTIYCASDHAVSEKQESDSTCMLTAGVDADGTLWILPDAFWERCDSLTMVDTMIARMRRHKPRVWWGENEVILKSIGPFLNRAMREQGVYCYLEPVKPAKDKQTRAQSIRGRLAAGAVRFPRFAPWYQPALDQMLKFPAGAHDDFVDTLAWLGLGLDSMLVGRKTPAAFDESRYFVPRPITLSWVKKSHNRLEQGKALALQDN